MGSRKTALAAMAAVLSLVATAAAELPSDATVTSSNDPPPARLALSFGTFPSHSLVQLEAFYAQLALYLTEAVGRPVRFGTSSSYGRFRERLLRNEFDVAFIQASEYTAIAARLGYVPLARARSAPLLFVVRPDSPVRNLVDLRGALLALPPMEEDGTTVALQRLREVGLQPDSGVSVEYLPQNNACLQHVISGRSAAAAVSEDALRFAGARPNVDYRVIDAGGQIPPPLFVASARLSSAERAAITTALRAWSSQPANQGSLMASGWMSLVSVGDGDYAVGRAGVPVQPADDSAKPAGAAASEPRRQPPRGGS